MCKKIFILFLILCLLTTLIGCRGVPTVPPISPEPEVSFSEEFVLVQVTDPESNIIFVTGKKNEDAIAILGEKNIAGEPTNITGTVYVSEQGDSFVIEAGIDGLPIHAIDSKGNKVIFENYTNSTVDLSIYNSNGDLIQGPTIINVDPADLLELKQLYNSFYSKQRWSRENTADVLKWGSLVIKWVSCGLSFYSGIVPVMAYVCGKAILSTIAAITPDDTDNVILMVVSTALCLFGDLTACVTGLLDVLAYGASMTETYTITASAGPHGSISPSGNVTVNHGSDKSFTITPVIGYSIDDVLVDGSSVGAVRSYTFTNVTENHTISATFLPVSIEGTTGKIAFASDRDGNNEIYVMNADGSNQTNLTNNPAWDNEPCFSPDGTKIAFKSYSDEIFGISKIYVMNADGSNQTRLTNNLGREPCFSPDGTKIAFASNPNGIFEIYVMNADGSNQTRLTNNWVIDWEPCFSPDGTKIAFASNRDGNYEIYVMNADGSNQTRLTNNWARDKEPCFSPDGTKIAFASDRDGNDEIYVMNADGSNVINLTNNPAWDVEPSWGP